MGSTISENIICSIPYAMRTSLHTSMLLCKAKRQYPLNACKVSRYCLSTLHDSIVMLPFRANDFEYGRWLHHGNRELTILMSFSVSYGSLALYLIYYSHHEQYYTGTNPYPEGNLFKFSAAWSCVSLPRPTTSSGWKLPIFVYLSTNIYKCWCLDTHFILNNSNFVD